LYKRRRTTITSFVLPARTISKGEKISYDYDFGLLEDECQFFDDV